MLNLMILLGMLLLSPVLLFRIEQEREEVITRQRLNIKPIPTRTNLLRRR